jgi:uncharacterized protein (DUF433 family)
LVTEVVPLHRDADGAIRVGSSRVTLDTIVQAFQDGESPESIVEQYPAVELADVYLVLGHILRHPEDLASYLSERRKQATQVRNENEGRYDPNGIRERLLHRSRLGSA